MGRSNVAKTAAVSKAIHKWLFLLVEIKAIKWLFCLATATRPASLRPAQEDFPRFFLLSGQQQRALCQFAQTNLQVRLCTSQGSHSEKNLHHLMMSLSARWDYLPRWNQQGYPPFVSWSLEHTFSPEQLNLLVTDKLERKHIKETEWPMVIQLFLVFCRNWQNSPLQCIVILFTFTASMSATRKANQSE